MSLLTTGWFWLLIAALLVAIVWILAARRSQTVETPNTPKLVTDPVCDMEFPVDRAVAKAGHGGKTYYFCAEACLRDFKRDPARYVGEPRESAAR